MGILQIFIKLQKGQNYVFHRQLMYLFLRLMTPSYLPLVVVFIQIQNNKKKCLCIWCGGLRLLAGMSFLKMSWGRASFRTLPLYLPPSLLPPLLPFFLYVKRLKQPRYWTVSNRFVCGGEASHLEYHNTILSLLVTLCPHPEHLWAWVMLRISSGGIKEWADIVMHRSTTTNI